MKFISQSSKSKLNSDSSDKKEMILHVFVPKHINFRAQIRSSAGSSLAVVKDNSFEFTLQETAEVFSQSGKSINLKPEPVAAIKSHSFEVKTCFTKYHPP